MSARYSKQLMKGTPSADVSTMEGFFFGMTLTVSSCEKDMLRLEEMRIGVTSGDSCSASRHHACDRICKERGREKKKVSEIDNYEN